MQYNKDQDYHDDSGSNFIEKNPVKQGYESVFKISKHGKFKNTISTDKSLRKF